MRVNNVHDERLTGRDCDHKNTEWQRRFACEPQRPTR